MPRPSAGYFNAAGIQVPGVHDVTSRYQDKQGLIHWAYGQGKAGKDLYEPRVLDVGTVVHRMAELDLRGAADPAISKVPFEMLTAREDIDTALRCYAEFRVWRQEHDVRIVAIEESLVSEQYQYGGTPDAVAVIDGQLSLLDLKTAKTVREVFLDQRLAMAAHGALWREHHPGRPVTAHHLLQLPKDGTKFAHHVFDDLATEWEMFRLQLACWRLEAHQREAAKAAKARLRDRPPTVTESPKRRWEHGLARLTVIPGGLSPAT